MKTHQQKYIAIFFLILTVIGAASCTKDFDQINTNPEASAQIQPSFVFTKAQYDGAKNNLNLLLGTMQYTTSFNDVAGFGSKYISSQSEQSSAVFNAGYYQEINELALVITAVAPNPEQVNMLAAARIWKAYCYSRITDLYGDIPYFQAAKGYTDASYKPAYDAQQAIYADLLKELDEAALSFNTTKPTFAAADLIYSGNIVQWKKFAYSLMLRLGMRMTKVDVGLAETWVKKAIAGGVITADADIAKINYLSAGQDINKNPISLKLYNDDYIKADGTSNTEGGKYQEYFITQLKTNKDPRLGIFSVVYVNKVPDTTAALQKGMPATFGSRPSDFATYSEPNLKTVVALGAAKIIIGAAETNFLLAEAVLRGWYSGATTSVLYENGLRSAFKQWAIISPTDGIISDLQINTYIKYHPLVITGTVEDQKKQIFTEFWKAVFPDAQEAFSSYRRTGYPALVPNNYVGNATNGQIFRRMLYPLSEQNLNKEGLAAAVARQGPDTFLTRIWWDKL
ncbi:SusD/RagB family nutrient-binding outer membrane lipoprotein [Pedobacter sp. MR2016-24]|uniref:SusD/RagB family nutrient-binding outer membrane lipoprotein n=1 Tax=Pedobacter sp. MR2016-24 TaxID=2994466 RepID=UPI00224749DC|nr:SusD/RagB family nutrient-binding outer membrane lipoprotein [Pedobacter sp. MR2016-24]MCX2486402.1 SusD/RagB family nutrient-binding outer membrane lipoprotein [Pedobacter sp. MR2016-24]